MWLLSAEAAHVADGTGVKLALPIELINRLADLAKVPKASVPILCNGLQRALTEAHELGPTWVRRDGYYFRPSVQRLSRIEKLMERLRFALVDFQAEEPFTAEALRRTFDIRAVGGGTFLTGDAPVRFEAGAGMAGYERDLKQWVNTISAARDFFAALSPVKASHRPSINPSDLTSERFVLTICFAVVCAGGTLSVDINEAGKKHRQGRLKTFLDELTPYLPEIWEHPQSARSLKRIKDFIDKNLKTAREFSS